MSKKADWLDGWATGFIAACYLFAGFRGRYEQLRDAMLQRRRTC
jgi:hypothetical protein